MSNIYIDNGYASREEYLDSLCEDYGTGRVNHFLKKFPPSQDFDGLIRAVEEQYYSSLQEDDEEEPEEEEDDWGGFNEDE
jgi:hypothetical protein